jgi:hypothetical protein
MTGERLAVASGLEQDEGPETQQVACSIGVEDIIHQSE